MKRQTHLLFVCLCALFTATNCFARPVKTDFSRREQTKAARGVVERTIGDVAARNFKVVISQPRDDRKDYFSLYADKGQIVLEGNNGVSTSSALNYYLKNYCNCHISWCGNTLTLPETLPLPQEKTTVVSPYKYRYYLNYCTFNYSMSWWDAERWQKEIDFMALNGINMPLAVTGQNSIWQRVYRQLGFTDEELDAFFSGPAYFNWFWMGNLDGWGGPLPQSFLDKHEELQRTILLGERSLGMTPVLPAFTGHVPPSFAQRFPEAKIRKTSWVNFDEVSILDPSEELFTEIGQMFLREQTKVFGTNHLYTADTFNENTPPTSDSLYLSSIASKVYNSMREVDSDAVWVMQGWLFYHERKFWGENEIKALLGAVPDDKMIILDLWSERVPVWSRTEAYYGKQWIWCMLQNFGQNITMSGNVQSVANDPAAALASPDSGKMLGVGLTMEGIGHSPFLYALMLENVWRSEAIDVDEFLHTYQHQRYGADNQDAFDAWRLLCNTAFENRINNCGHESIITARPTFKLNPRGTGNTKACYERSAIVGAWDSMIKAAAKLDSDGFRYDLVDVTRQTLGDYASDIQQECAAAYEAKNADEFGKASARFMAMIDDMERLLATRSEFLLGGWLEDAKAMGTTAEESALYERNARDLLTLWGNRDCKIHDYACRQWSGMMSGFYRPRWQHFFDAVNKALADGEEFSQTAFNEQIKDWEWQWIGQKECYPTAPSGDEISICLALYDKYRGEMK